MWTGPPNSDDCPNPMSSIRTMSTLGAPVGALTSKRGGAFALRASSSVNVGGAGAWIGSTVRSRTPTVVEGVVVLVPPHDMSANARQAHDPTRRVLGWFITVVSLVSAVSPTGLEVAQII